MTELMQREIKRKDAVYSLTIANGAAVSGAFDMSDYVMGEVHIPNEWTDANIGFKSSTTESGTYLPVYDADGAIVEITNIGTATARAYTLPAEVATCKWVKLWSQDGSAGDTNQGAARSLTVVIKS